MRNANEIVLTGSAAVDQTSVALNINNHFGVSVQAVVTGTSTGTLKIQVSNDLNAPVNWSDLSGATVSIAGAGTYLIPKQDTCYTWMQLVFTHSNGASGTISVTFKTNGY